ncbi:MAG: CBS domain-containing protein [Burkholderiales bacterium]
MSARTIRSIIEGQELVSAQKTTPVREAARLMKQHNVGAIVVVEGDKLVGVFTERDALFRVVAEGRDAGATELGAVMTPNPKTVGADSPFSLALQMMYEGGFRNVPVVEDGRPVGLVSARDALGPELKEFVYEMLRQEQTTDVLA